MTAAASKVSTSSSSQGLLIQSMFCTVWLVKFPVALNSVLLQEAAFDKPSWAIHPADHVPRRSDGAWPTPVPYPEVFKKNSKDLCNEELKKLVVNAHVILLNYLGLERSARAPATCRDVAPLNDKQ